MSRDISNHYMIFTGHRVLYVEITPASNWFAIICNGEPTGCAYPSEQACRRLMADIWHASSHCNLEFEELLHRLFDGGVQHDTPEELATRHKLGRQLALEYQRKHPHVSRSMARKMGYVRASWRKLPEYIC